MAFVNGLCAGNSPGTGDFPAQRASNAENVSIWRRHHVLWVFMVAINRIHVNNAIQISYQVWFYYIVRTAFMKYMEN